MNNEMIERLKGNERAFWFLSPDEKSIMADMQELRKVQWLDKDGNWSDNVPQNYINNLVFRIKPDYQPEAESEDITNSCSCFAVEFSIAELNLLIAILQKYKLQHNGKASDCDSLIGKLQKGKHLIRPLLKVKPSEPQRIKTNSGITGAHRLDGWQPPKPESEFVEIDIVRVREQLCFGYYPECNPIPIDSASGFYDFYGFLYENGTVSASPVLYKNDITISQNNSVYTLTPTGSKHDGLVRPVKVLFRKGE